MWISILPDPLAFGRESPRAVSYTHLKQIEKLDLLEETAAKLQTGGYNGQFVVLYYQPDTREKTIVNTEIPVNITVEP